MDHWLDSETRQMIEDRMKRGGYASPDDAVRAALNSLAERETEGDFEPGECDHLLEQGENSGSPLDGEQVLAELRELRTRQQSKAG
jgi:Arc/MetJ-type ribon-helix-helix transcriptional regulator